MIVSGREGLRLRNLLANVVSPFDTFTVEPRVSSAFSNEFICLQTLFVSLHKTAHQRNEACAIPTRFLQAVTWCDQHRKIAANFATVEPSPRATKCWRRCSQPSH